MRCDVLHVLETVDHEQLRQDGQRFQPNTEGPQKVDRVERFMRDDGSEQRRAIEVIMREGVRLPIETEVVWLLDAHEVYGVGSQADEDDLHDEHVQRLPAEEEVDVAREEHRQEKLLRSVGQP